MAIATTASLMLLVLAPANSEQASVELDLQNLRNSRGVLQLCITAHVAVFPDCSRDPKAIKRSFPADGRRLLINSVPPGHYAITLFHDENGNRKLDTMLGIPREGFGFSRNPVIRFGAPKFRQVGIDLKPGISRHVIKLQYLL